MAFDSVCGTVTIDAEVVLLFRRGRISDPNIYPWHLMRLKGALLGNAERMVWVGALLNT